MEKQNGMDKLLEVYLQMMDKCPDAGRIELRDGGMALIMERSTPTVMMPPHHAFAPIMHHEVASVSHQAAASSQEVTAPNATEAAIKGTAVVSPIVGTFYAAPAPDAAPFVAVGQKVTKGQVLCIVEAMKMLNEIEAETDGTVLEISAANGDLVEFGQKLFVIG